VTGPFRVRSSHRSIPPMGGVQDTNPPKRGRA
jgi:hypothetical protein